MYSGRKKGTGGKTPYTYMCSGTRTATGSQEIIFHGLNMDLERDATNLTDIGGTKILQLILDASKSAVSPRTEKRFFGLLLR